MSIRMENCSANRTPRGWSRFPSDFLFELSDGEIDDMVSQNVIPGRGKLGGASPMAFTEQGVAMLSSVLHSPRAIAINIEIMRAFVRLRAMASTNKELAGKLNELERKLSSHDQAIAGILDAIRRLMAPPPQPRKRSIGFIRQD